MRPPTSDQPLLDVLARARSEGAVGPGDLGDHLRNARRFSPAVLAGCARGATGAPPLVVDLGSGGGLPGLVLAVDHPAVHWVFVEARQQRADFLGWAVGELGLEGQVEVVAERAETLGREGQYRGSAQVVTARSFGSPAVTAECGAPLLRTGGVLVVSEPPASTGDRWPACHLETLGLNPVGVTGGIMTLEKVSPTDSRYPRRPGIPAKRPLF